MLSADDIAAIPLFAGLVHADRERLAQAAADVHLRPGEYAVHEGEERALFAVISGKIEVTKRMEGGEKTIGWRLPGTIFGEVPITLGASFPGSFRASEPTRVLRLDARQYYVIAAAAPEVAVAVGALARERLGGLQGLAAKPPIPRSRSSATAGTPPATTCGGSWPATRWSSTGSPRTPRSSPRAGPAGPPTSAGRPWASRTEASSPGHRSGTWRTAWGSRPRRARPSTTPSSWAEDRPAWPRRSTAPPRGSGPWWWSARHPAGRPGPRRGSRTTSASPIGVSGDELAARALDQAKRLGRKSWSPATSSASTPRRQVVLDGDEVLRARTIILATGVSWRRLAIEGIDRLIGKGVYYGAARSEASNTQGLDVFLIGAGNSAGQAALHFASHARSVTLVVRGDALEKTMSRYLVDQSRGKSNVRSVSRPRSAPSTGTITSRRSTSWTAPRSGAAARVWWPVRVHRRRRRDRLATAGLARDARGYVLTGADVMKGGHWSATRDPYLLETSVPGIFACGDVRYSPVKRVASAVGEGSMAIAFVHQYLQNESGSLRPEARAVTPPPGSTSSGPTGLERNALAPAPSARARSASVRSVVTTRIGTAARRAPVRMWWMSFRPSRRGMCTSVTTRSYSPDGEALERLGPVRRLVAGPRAERCHRRHEHLPRGAGVIDHQDAESSHRGTGHQFTARSAAAQRVLRAIRGDRAAGTRPR